MPASLAVLAHWSVSQVFAAKRSMLVTPGVHSWVENVLNDQQTNMPKWRFCSASHGSAARRQAVARWFGRLSGQSSALPEAKPDRLR